MTTTALWVIAAAILIVGAILAWGVWTYSTGSRLDELTAKDLADARQPFLVELDELDRLDWGWPKVTEAEGPDQ